MSLPLVILHRRLRSTMTSRSNADSETRVFSVNAYRQRFLSIEDRFFSHVERIPFSGCWIWDSTGKRYGKFWLNGRTEKAHRAAWLMFRGSISEGQFICHICDVPCCVNPDHLFIGSPKDNTQDMISKGRDGRVRQMRRGEKSNFAKLTEKQVVAIKTDDRLQRVIAADYGITQPAISLIKSGKNWKHANT